MNHLELVKGYVKSKEFAWARTTQRNELARLKKHGERVLEPPALVYLSLSKSMKPYSIKTTLSRMSLFYQWLIDNDKIPPSKNPWKAFLSENALLFKYAYQIERLTIAFDEAKARIETMPDYAHRMASLQLIEGGLRYCELRTFDGRQVIGKGGKPRAVFLRPELALFRYTGSYSALYIRLKAVGLKPHTLRKLCATEFSRDPKVKDQDTCKVFGWSSIETSIKYRQPHQDKQLGEILQGVVNKAKPEIKTKSIFAKWFSKVTI